MFQKYNDKKLVLSICKDDKTMYFFFKYACSINTFETIFTTSFICPYQIVYSHLALGNFVKTINNVVIIAV